MTLFVTDFTLLQQTCPFDANVVGIMRAVGDVCESTKGVPMRSFELVDRNVHVVRCIAFGDHALSETLGNQHEVAIFFANAKSGMPGESGRLWVYDSAHIILLRTNVGISLGREVDIALA